MEMRYLRPVTLTLAGAVLLGGCATYGASAPTIAYVPAPCGAPGAVRVLPVAPAAGPLSTGPAGTVPAAPPPPVAATADGSPSPAGDRCLVAVAGGRPGGYYGPGYPYRYGYRGYRGARLHGSLGLGIAVRGHGRAGGHLRAGHGGGRHGGGRH